MNKTVYLDNAATTKTASEVVEAMLPYFTENFGNPSSVYTFSNKSREAVLEARETIANAIGAKKEEIYFTAGGTESDNWALKATADAYQSKGNHIIVSKIEHHAILHTCDYLEKKGFEITYIDVDEDGVLKLDELEKAIRPETILISVMLKSYYKKELSEGIPITLFSLIYLYIICFFCNPFPGGTECHKFKRNSFT